MHYSLNSKTGLNDDSADFLDSVGFDQCHAAWIQKTTAYSEIAEIPKTERIASDVDYVTAGEFIFVQALTDRL